MQTVVGKCARMCVLSVPGIQRVYGWFARWIFDLAQLSVRVRVRRSLQHISARAAPSTLFKVFYAMGVCCGERNRGRVRFFFKSLDFFFALARREM